MTLGSGSFPPPLDRLPGLGARADALLTTGISSCAESLRPTTPPGKLGPRRGDAEVEAEVLRNERDLDRRAGPKAGSKVPANAAAAAAELAAEPMVKALSPGDDGGGADDAGAGAAKTPSGVAVPKCAVDCPEEEGPPPDMSDGRENGPAPEEPSEVAIARAYPTPH